MKQLFAIAFSIPFVVMGYVWEFMAHGFLTGRLYLAQKQGRVQVVPAPPSMQEAQRDPTFH